jgi:hypothetical protein
VKWGVPLALRNENVDESMHLTRIELVVSQVRFPTATT